jgi:hypothetical protein
MQILKQILENPNLLDAETRKKLIQDLVKNIDNLDPYVKSCMLFYYNCFCCYF